MPIRKKEVKTSSFARQVYQACSRIPRGKVATYQDLARAIGKPRASRAVGQALNRNPWAPVVPCHRVIKATGEIGGFAGGQDIKIAYLRREGITVKGLKIELARYRYQNLPK